MLPSMRHTGVLQVVVGLLMGGLVITVPMGVYEMASHHNAAGWWAATAACVAAAVLVTVFWLGIHPLFVWGSGKTAEWRINAATLKADQQKRMAALETASPAVGADPNRIEIMKAVYAGLGGSDDQLAERVRGLLSDDGRRLSFVVCNEVLGAGDPSYDPAPNHEKTLTLTFRFGGTEHTLTVRENQEVNLP
jgi:hypothetical protein